MKQVDPNLFDPGAFRCGSGEQPASAGSIAFDDVFTVLPFRIGHGSYYGRKGFSNYRLACDTFPIDFIAGGGEKYAVICHHTHHVVKIMSVEGISKSIQKLCTNSYQ
jgi:hypothetical protein